MTEQAQTAAAPAWAKGHDVDYLKRITAVFKKHDAGMVHGAFGRYGELDAVADLERGSLLVGDDLEWVASAYKLERRTSIKDFTGATRVVLEPPLYYVKRMAWQTMAGAVRFAALLHEVSETSTLALWAWQEHVEERSLVEALPGLALAAVKITAASEMRGLYLGSAGLLPAVEPYPRQQAIGLGTLRLDLPPDALAELCAETAGLSYAQHYSGYNKGGSWTALALRGFYDDPERIEKPAEMGKKWKAEHEPDLANEPRDTSLRAQLPAAEALLERIPCRSLERVRLMSLAPGGGELTRHADITDLAAGAEPGRVVRVHIPLITNEDCVFQSWDLDGQPHRLHMAVGSAYYLDTRKPHTAVNEGEVVRIHFVVDAVADERLCELLADSEEAPVA